MVVSAYFPYRSEAVKESCLAYLDSLATRQWPIASETRMVPTPFGPTFVRISGPSSAPPLALLHGAGSTSLMWAPNVQALSERYRTIAIDQIQEFGRSECTKPIQSLKDMAHWLEGLFDGLGISGGLNVAGLSYGGALATQYALAFPNRVSNLILLAPANTVLRLRAAAMARLALAVLAKKRGIPAMVHWMFADMLRKDPAWGDETIDLLFVSLNGLQRRNVPIPPVLTDAEWGSLKCPVLFLVGEHEVIYSPEKAVQRLSRVAPMATAEIVPGAGHDLSFVKADLVNRRMLEFLDGRRGRDGTIAPAA